MVKREKKRPRGRPPGDPEDLRTERVAVRAHKDLVNELNHLAREQGVTRSVMIERLLIDFVNDEARSEIVDMIGRYTGTGNPVASAPKSVRDQDRWRYDSRSRRPK